MLIIGERINATRKFVHAIVANRDAKGLQALARRQIEAGAHVLDVNVASETGSPEAESEAMAWAVKIIHEVAEVPLAIDSDHPPVMQVGLATHGDPAPFLNSVTGEEAKLDALLPMIRETGASVICLAIGDSGIPENAEERVSVCRQIRDRALQEGIPAERLYFDPLVLPAATGEGKGSTTLRTLRRLKGDLPGAKTVVGLSNVSFGLPARSVLNRTFLAMCMGVGLDAAILDPLAVDVMEGFRAAEALLGTDRRCQRYVRAYRSRTKGV
ncbi:MAG: dihydropteroate synthase [Planctomycetota bacterium]|jgi:5-methyltetrahydrofolate--homocysteine methyltransferase